MALAAVFLALVPVLLFYGLLWRQTFNLPMTDDYDAVLRFTEDLARTPTATAKLALFVASQHVQYKLLFEEALVSVEYLVTGRLNFFFLATLGNLFVLAVGWALWLVFPVERGDWPRRLLLFLPVIYLLFELQYAETLSWTVGGLQNIPVIAFSLLSLSLLARPGGGHTAWASLCLALAIASSGNGFFLALTGGLMLLQMRRWRSLLLWAGTTLLMLAAYLYRYQPMAVASPGGHARWSAVLFPAAFLGSLLPVMWINVVLGAVLGLLAGAAALRGRLWRTHPPLFYSLVFLWITALGVAVTRSSLGLIASQASRYRIYSALMAALVYMVLLVEWQRAPRLRTSLRSFVCASLLLSAAFCVQKDLSGLGLLRGRTAKVKSAMGQWARSGGAQSPIPPPPPELRTDPVYREYMDRSRLELETAIRMKIFLPEQWQETPPAP